MKVGNLDFQNDVAKKTSFEYFKSNYNKPKYLIELGTTIEKAWELLGGEIPPEEPVKEELEVKISDKKVSKKSKK